MAACRRGGGTPRCQLLQSVGADRQNSPLCFRAPLITTLLVAASSAMAIDLKPLWDFDDPAASEARFQAALLTAKGDDALILQTQIARSHGLRLQFDRARSVLQGLEPQLPTAGDEARARYWLELGRTYASAAHPPASQSPEAQATAREDFGKALATAKAGQLDSLAIDALHMLAFVDTAPADQLEWGRQALAVSQASIQPAAKAWEASLRNNIGCALHELGRYDEALDQFGQAVVLREHGTDQASIWIAHWMVGWTLRAMRRDDEALAIQLRLAAERTAAGKPDPYIFEELALLYRAKGDAVQADHYAALKEAVAK